MLSLQHFYTLKNPGRLLATGILGLMGCLALPHAVQAEENASFGEANDQGLYPVRGEWSIEWGIKAEISGIIQATIAE